MTRAPTTQERVDAIRAVRLAAHGLENVCRAIVGGTQMAISLPTVDTIGQSVADIESEGRDGDDQRHH